MPIPKKENKDNTNIKDGSVELKQPNNSKTLKTDEIKETISKKEANIVKEVYEFKDDNWQDESLLDTEVLKTKSTGERKISLGIYKKIAISFLVATLILAAFIVYLYLVKVSITIVPAKEKLNTNMIVSVLDTEKHKGLTKENSVIGVVKEIEITDSEEFESTGKKLIDNEIVGEVEIVNNYNKNQPLVASTRILSPDNKIFRIKNTVTVLAGKSVRVPIYTEKTDKEYAIGPTNFTIPGLWSGIQDKIYARSDSAFIYQENSKRFITNVDILNAKEKMKATI
ncbi:MAG: hypothetical protein NT091_00520, partial [Candidatus Falkowbacteria bacterium]|nr:hypothetical protein [Candidatus Falkowbacteria bacterium]